MLSYQVVEGWEQLPAGFTHLDCAGVSVDSQDNVYLLTRAEPRLLVYRAGGEFLRSWGEDLFTERTHGVTVGPDASVYCVDEGAHCIYKFTLAGDLLLTIGTKDTPADTGFDGTSASIRGGPPFNRPTNPAVAPSGELYVSDGYGNCKVHCFSASGALMDSWGQPGIGPGEFNLPHGIAINVAGQVLVADRENDRIQVFAPHGRLLGEWVDVQRPTNIALDGAGRVYVSELAWRIGEQSQRHGDIHEYKPGRVSVFDADGQLLARWGGPDPSEQGSFVAPHDIAVDSAGDLYVAEVTHTFAGGAGHVPPGSHTLQKFTRQRAG